MTKGRICSRLYFLIFTQKLIVLSNFYPSSPGEKKIKTIFCYFFESVWGNFEDFNKYFITFGNISLVPFGNSDVKGAKIVTTMLI